MQKQKTPAIKNEVEELKHLLEQKNRELETEAALERVRSRSLGMQRTDQLNELIGMIFIELKKLDVVLLRCVIVIYEADKRDQRWWMANSEDPDNPINLFIKHLDLPPNEEFIRAWEKRLQKWVYYMEGDIKREWDERMLNETELSLLPESVKNGMRDPAPTYCHASFNHFGCLTFVAPEPIRDSQFDILIRFAKVFDQSYTRFLDLQKAEAQAREAQIGLALERVRSAAMAMHHSDELTNTIGVLFEQLTVLGINPVNTYMTIIDLEKDKFNMRITGKDGDRVPVSMDISFKEIPRLRHSQIAFERGHPIIENHFEGEDRNDWLKLTQPLHEKFNANTRLSEEDFPDGIYSCAGRHSIGTLGILHTRPATEEEKQLLIRFAREFDLVYKRFLDLQKAEAQAREAQIEAALERVRAKSLAMHQSDELQEVIHVVFKEVKKLGINADSCIININEPGNYDINMWISNQERTYSNLVKIPYSDHPVMVDYAEARKNKIDLITNRYSKEEGYNFFSDAFKNSALKIAPKKWQKLVLTAPSYIRSMALNKHTCIGINNYHNRPFTENENDILKR
jgi:hypothetical protein